MRNYVLLIFISTIFSTISPNVSNKHHQSVNLNNLILDTKAYALYNKGTYNNPFNIRKVKHNKWVGKLNTPAQFEVFETKELGIRAGLKLLGNYQRKYKLNTIDKIIRKYAPANENNTEQYIANVVKITGYQQHQKLNLTKKSTLITLAYAITICEGNKVSEEKLLEVYTKYFINA